MSRLIVRESRLIDGKIALSGNILLNHQPKICVFTVRKFRDEEITEDFPIHLTGPISMTPLRYIASLTGIRWHKFTVTLDFPWAGMPSSIYGLGYRVGEKATSPTILKQACRILSDDEVGRSYYIFVEPSVRVPRIEMYHLGSKELAQLTEQSNLPRPQQVSSVIGEYTNTARDNGKALFEWIRKNAPDIRSTYVVEKENIDEYSVESDGVTIFGSVEHLSRCIDAHVCAFTHHQGYVYPYIIHALAAHRYNDTRTIFLQHGIIAMKKSIISHYRRKRVGYDAFCVSSQAEKGIITRHFGYDNDQVFATGLARYDSLFHKSKNNETPSDGVLIFPTWRQGLEKQTSEEVAKSLFVMQWQDAMTMISETGVRTTLVLHPMLQRHAKVFAPYVDEIRETRDFQDALVNASALVTDYSSVSFDALFLQKPVFLFQFDQDEMGLKEEAFIDIETQLPGHVSFTPEELALSVSEVRAAKWSFVHQPQRELYFDHCDDLNSARISELIRTFAQAN